MPQFVRTAACAAVIGVLSLPSAGAARAEILITVDKTLQRMTVVVDRQHRYTWPVSTGVHPTPSGTFRPYILSRHHRSRLFNNAPMPYAIFYSGHYAIHGTTAVAQIGARASKGCVRLHPSNAAVLFALVQEHGMASTQIVVGDGAQQIARR
jgi:lipoprotein-anchoring transpeptidase ErfK/SrfK